MKGPMKGVYNPNTKHLYVRLPGGTGRDIMTEETDEHGICWEIGYGHDQLGFRIGNIEISINREGALERVSHILSEEMHKRALANAGALPEGQKALTTHEIELRMVDAILGT